VFIEVKWTPDAVQDLYESFHDMRQPVASWPARVVAGTAQVQSAGRRAAESNRWFRPNAWPSIFMLALRREDGKIRM